MVGQYKVIGCLKDLKKIKYDKVIVAIGDNKKRKMITDKLKVKYFTAVHPSAVISKAAKISDGCMILGGVIVNAGAYVGRHTILNTGCTIDHHNNIGCFAHIAPGVHLGGNVKIGEGTLVGIGATVINNINIGKWSVVGAGAVVVRNIGGQIITYGTPAKFIRNIDKI
jgi:acetyltransferase EpsM